jgi:hypothetical protein
MPDSFANPNIEEATMTSQRKRVTLLRKGALHAMAAAALAVTALAIAGPKAEATTLTFTLSGDYNTSWQMDSNPTPTGVDNINGVNFFLGVPGIDPLYLIFFSNSIGLQSGGIRASTGTDLNTEVGAIFDLGGDQIFTGSLAAPVFAPGLFTLNQDFVTNAPLLSTTTLKISLTSVATTPIPAALPLFLTGLLGLGFAEWRRRKAASGA